jgi:hypothetical protein
MKNNVLLVTLVMSLGSYNISADGHSPRTFTPPFQNNIQGSTKNSFPSVKNPVLYATPLALQAQTNPQTLLRSLDEDVEDSIQESPAVIGRASDVKSVTPVTSPSNDAQAKGYRVFARNNSTASESAVSPKASRVGDPTTYAPSEAENMLSHLISGLRQLRIDNYSIFRKYFERQDQETVVADEIGNKV